MLDGVNDHPDDAKLLANEIKDMRAIVNLIPFNQWPGAPYRCSSHERIYEFHSILMQAGINAPIRWPRGSDILAACGQLQSNYQQSATIA
jgi:23S rRNA (adenine2503-C2)-methyltransferase